MQSVKQIDASVLNGMLRDGKLQLVDVRTEQEVARGVIDGARHIPLSDFVARTDELDPHRPVVIYCLSGARSMSACQFLVSNGWPDVSNLSGGIVGWSSSGLPLGGTKE